MQIILNALWIFIIIYNFIWQHFRLQHMVRMQHLMHIYIFGVSINRMLILKLKIFLSVFTLILYVILLLFLISML